MIIGFGVNGRNVHRAMKLLEVPHVVVDLNPHTVGELDLRRVTGATVLAVHNGQEVTTNPSADTVLSAGNRLVALVDGECEARLREMVS